MPKNYYSSWAQYTIQLENTQQRDEFQQKLKEHSIPTMVYYPKPLQKQTVYKNQGLTQYVECSVTQKLCKVVLSLPLDPYKKQENVKSIIKHFIN